jgi:hypothetical protein
MTVSLENLNTKAERLLHVRDVILDMRAQKYRLRGGWVHLIRDMQGFL